MSLYRNIDFTALDRPLARLFDDAGRRSFFSRPGWYGLMAQHGVPAGVETRVYMSGDTALACRTLLPGEPWCFGRSLLSLTNAFSVEHDLVQAGGASVEDVARIAQEVASERPRWDTVAIFALDPASAGFAALSAALRQAGLRVYPVFDFGVWYEETAGWSYERYLGERPSALRSTIRRKGARVAREGRGRARFFDTGDDIETAVAAYETVYAASWKEQEAHAGFIPALIRQAAGAGALRLGVYEVDGQPAAAQFWIVWDGRACLFKLAHDERFAEGSVGTLLTAEMTRRVLERDRPTEINLGRGDDPYKKLWLPRRRERWGLLAANPRTASGLRVIARATAKAVLEAARLRRS